MSPDDTLYGRIKNGVLTMSGNNPSIRVDGGCLVVRDGPSIVSANHRGAAPPIGERMATVRLTRAEAASGALRHIVITRPDGFITFAALEWLHSVGCAISHLKYDGTLVFASGLAGPDRPTLRRAQALAAGDETGLAIMREILRVKLAGQAEVARHLFGNEETGAQIVRLAGEIENIREGAQLLAIEAMAAAAYWTLWLALPLRFARQDKVPEHWQTFGLRKSPLTGKPFKAATPGNALLNYLYAVMASEMKIALAAVSMDPGIGIFHADRDLRSSLAYDVLEAVRPYVDAWLAHWLTAARFAKRDFHEEPDGAIRLTRPLTDHLVMTAPMWRTAATPVAHWFAEALASGSAEIRPPLGATNDRRRLAPPLLAFSAPRRAWQGLQPPIPKTCHECGKALEARQRKFCSQDCAMSFHADLAAVHVVDRNPGNEGEPAPRIAAKNRRHLAERRAWDAQHTPGEGLWNSRSKLNPKQDRLRRWYAAELAPRLATLRPSVLARATGLTIRYGIMLRQGYVPHPRHYPALAKLAGVPAPKALEARPDAGPGSGPRRAAIHRRTIIRENEHVE